MFATQTGKTRTVDAGMWCNDCGDVVQCHVDPGADRDLIEKAVRSQYEQLEDVPTLCVIARGSGAWIVAGIGEKHTGFGVGWTTILRTFEEAEGMTADTETRRWAGRGMVIWSVPAALDFVLTVEEDRGKLVEYMTALETAAEALASMLEQPVADTWRHESAPCGCTWDSALVPVPCSQHDPTHEAVAALRALRELREKA